MSERAPCRHCGLRPANRPRQLCWTCYFLPGVRELYAPRDDRYLPKRFGVVEGTAACEPTDAAPGSEQKMDVLHGRLRRGERLWHENDARLSLE